MAWPLVARLFLLGMAAPAAAQTTLAVEAQYGQYEGKAVESQDGRQVLLFGALGYQGRLERGRGGWARFGPHGG